MVTLSAQGHTSYASLHDYLILSHARPRYHEGHTQAWLTPGSWESLSQHLLNK